MERKRIYKDPWCKCLVFDLRQDSRWKRNAEGENLVCVFVCLYNRGFSGFHNITETLPFQNFSARRLNE